MKQVTVDKVQQMRWPVLEPVEAAGVPRPIALHRPVCVAGAKPEANLIIGSSSISRVHALLVNDSDGVYVRDLASRNKVYLNDVAVREAVLGDGDLLALGSAIFRCRNHFNRDAHPSTTPDLELKKLDNASKVVVQGRTAVLGRRSQCDIRVEGEEVAPVHAVIFRREGRWFIRNLATATGTKINGSPVGDSELKAGDRLRVGPVEFECRVGGVGADLACDDEVGIAPPKSSEETVAVAADDILSEEPATDDSQTLHPADLDDWHSGKHADPHPSESNNLHLSHLEELEEAPPQPQSQSQPKLQQPPPKLQPPPQPQPQPQQEKVQPEMIRFASWRNATTSPTLSPPPPAKLPAPPRPTPSPRPAPIPAAAATNPILPKEAVAVADFSQLELSDSHLPDLRHIALEAPAPQPAPTVKPRAAVEPPAEPPTPAVATEQAEPSPQAQIDSDSLALEPAPDHETALTATAVSNESDFVPLEFEEADTSDVGPLDLSAGSIFSPTNVTNTPSFGVAAAVAEPVAIADAVATLPAAPQRQDTVEPFALPIEPVTDAVKFDAEPLPAFEPAEQSAPDADWLRQAEPTIAESPSLDQEEQEFSQMLQKIREDLARVETAWQSLLARRRQSNL